MNLEEKVDSFIRNVFTGSERGAHTYDHTKRVYVMTAKIGEKLGANCKEIASQNLRANIICPKKE